MRAVILKALAGSSGQNPVSGEVLAKLGPKDAVLEAINTLLDGRPAAINTARVMRGGVWSDMYWLTGGVEKFNMHEYRVNPNKTPAGYTPKKVQETAERVNQKTSIQEEKAMKTAPIEQKTDRSELRPALFKYVEENPGIRWAELVGFGRRMFPNIPEKTITKTIDNLWRSAQRIRFEGDGKLRKVFVNEAKLKAAKPVQVKPVVKAAAPVVQTKKAAPVQAVAPAPIQSPAPATTAPIGKKLEEQEGTKAWAEHFKKTLDAIPPVTADSPEYFSLLLSDDDHLFINLGDEAFRLNPAQVQRLDNFLARVFLDGVKLGAQS